MDLLTRHCILGKHMSHLGLTEEIVYRFCQTEEKTAIHVYSKPETYVEGVWSVMSNEESKANVVDDFNRSEKVAVGYVKNHPVI
ncbi:hypothetical protein Trydic_g7861 [Trypoxylus dichotomus]